MSRKRLIAFGVGLAIVVAVVVRVVAIASSGRSTDSAVESTGASAAVAITPAASATVPVAPKALLVLNPRSVRHGESIGVWGSGFPSGGTVAIYLKQDAADNVNPVTVVEADRSGHFGGVSVTVPESVSSGGLIIAAQDREHGMSATAAATVIDDATEAQVQVEATPVIERTDEPRPTATPYLESTATPQATSQPKATQQPTSQPTAQPEPPEQPQATPQPTATGQPQPTAPPKPTEQPQATPQPKATDELQPKPTEEPNLNAKSSGSNYTVRPGDSLSAIAEQVYGNGTDWRSVYDANRGAIGGNPDLIQPGTELVIPSKD